MFVKSQYKPVTVALIPARSMSFSSSSASRRLRSRSDSVYKDGPPSVDLAAFPAST